MQATADQPIRLPDARSIETALAKLAPGASDADLAEALGGALAGLAFSVAPIDDFYWLSDRSVLRSDGTRIGDYASWVTSELAAERGDIGALWKRLQTSDLALTEWRGHTVFAFASTGPGLRDYFQIRLGREIEYRAGPLMPDWPPGSVDDLIDPSWTRHDDTPANGIVGGPRYRLLGGRAGGSVAHVRSLLRRCAQVERDQREARRPELERRLAREVGPDGVRDMPFLQMTPNRFDHVPREVRFFDDWEASSASAQPIQAYWGLDIRDYEYRGQREVGFIPRPLRQPTEQLKAESGMSIHRLIERAEEIDRELGLPFGWFFLATHGHWVEPDVARAIAAGLRQERVRLPDRDAKVLLRWDEDFYAF